MYAGETAMDSNASKEDRAVLVRKHEAPIIEMAHVYPGNTI
jgi:hypothetical protein